MSIDFTVAICTYNGAERLPEVLDCLRSQTNTEAIHWKILIVDNNSTDNTAGIVATYQKNWPLAAPIEYCLETQQGSAWARKRAIKEANSPLIGFLDDDNLPNPTWVAAAYQFGQDHPQAGAYGSQIHGAFEVELPPNFERIVPFLAITERGQKPLLYEPRKKLLPPSAGLVVRRAAWTDSVPSQCILSGRVPGSMGKVARNSTLPGEDIEAMSYVQQAGWEIWYNPAMEIRHKIPRWRLERDYLIPFFRGIGLSRYVTRSLSVKPWQRPFISVAYMANDLRKIISHLLKYGTTIQTDLVAACELTLFLNSFISPFYIWKQQYLDATRSETSG